MKRNERGNIRAAVLIYTLPLIIICLAVVLLNTGCKKKAVTEEKIITENRMGIVLTSGAALRIDPLLFSARLELLNKGDTVKILEKSNDRTWIGKTSDYWYKIRIENGIEGWLFGENIRLISPTDKNEVNAYVADFFKGETEEMMKNIMGKWWSVNRFGDFTYHGLELYPDGKYKSYYKSENPRIIEGEYTIDFNNNKLLFDKGATFGKELDFLRRGFGYVFKKEQKVGELVFKKISVKLEEKEEKGEKKKVETK